MPIVSGSLKLVTGSPDAVSQVWLRAPKGRVQGAEYVTESPDTVQVTGGAVSFDALPGALVMTLVSHGAPIQAVKLLVPDKSTATLAECIEAAELATDGTRNALERLALEVQAELGQVPSLVSTALAQDATIIDAVKQASALRVDTSVGTRVFAGETMIYGDTGWRNVSGQLEPGVTGNVFITRVGQTVHMMLHNVSTGNAGHTGLISLPTGFRPFSMSGANWRNGMLTTDNGDTVRATSYHNGFMRVLNMPTGKTFGGSISMVAESAWPTTLPGIPA